MAFLRRFSTLLLLPLALGGCVRPVSEPPPAAETAVDVAPSLPPGVPVRAGPVSILVSDDTPAYKRVAQLVAGRLKPPPAVHALDGDQQKADKTVRAVARRDNAVVAVGLLAAQAAAGLKNKPVVFCQVFNYHDTGIVGAKSFGVAVLPPARKQFEAWRLLDPKLKRVAVITGHGLGHLIGEARAAADRVGLELAHVEVRTDREFLYAVRRLGADAQGLWILPDNRVLSAAALHNAVTHAVRDGKQVVGFSPELLKLGALMSVESEAGDVAEQVLLRLLEIRGELAPRSARVVPLRRAAVEVNLVRAQQLGLTVPPMLRGGRHVF